MSKFLTVAQTMIYLRLSVELAPQKVFDFMPVMPSGKPSSDMPYIVIGDDNSRPWDTDDSLGSTVFCTIHVWTQEAGNKSVKQILGDIDEALNRSALFLSYTGYKAVDCLYDYSEVFSEKDGATKHGVCRYKLTLEKE
jgi:hypothetical protein